MEGKKKPTLLGTKVVAAIESALRARDLTDARVRILHLKDVGERPLAAPRGVGLIADVQTNLEKSGMGQFQVKTLELRLGGVTRCPQGTVPKLVCETLPNGEIRCFTKCVKE